MTLRLFLFANPGKENNSKPTKKNDLIFLVISIGILYLGIAYLVKIRLQTKRSAPQSPSPELTKEVHIS